MPEVLEPPRWQAVGLVIDQNARDFLNGRTSLVEDLVAWFKAVDLFRLAEDEHLYLHDPTPDDLRQHRTWISSLTAEGERLVTEVQGKGGLPEGVVSFKLADVEAAIENLRIDDRMWHQNTLSPERRREILKAVFNVEES
ncbi:MAG: hypothetical protein HYY23_14585 [Verrucomicrobia bacterium]|nr:hypothetical protein [Verrucomicrobiota bacterium]